MTSPWQQLTTAVATRPSSPFITWYGPNTRTELSVLTYANAMAKTVGFLQSDLMLDPGDEVALPIGMHWQSTVWLGACATVGLAVDLRPTADSEHAPDTSVAFRESDLRGTDARNKVVISDHPMGLPGAPLPAGFFDHARDAMGQPDILPSDVDRDWDAFRLTDTSGTVEAADLPGLVAETVSKWQLPESATVLVAPQPGDRIGWLAAWAVPLATDGHAVLCDPALPITQRRQIAATENVSATVPRLT